MFSLQISFVKIKGWGKTGKVPKNSPSTGFQQVNEMKNIR